MNNGEREPHPPEEPEVQSSQRIDNITTETQPPGFFINHAPKIVGGLAATLAVGSVLLVSKSCDSSHENKPSANPTPATQTKYGLSVKELLDKHPNALQLTNIPRPKIDEMLDNTSALQALRLNTYEVRCYNTPARLVSAFILQGGNSQPQPRYAQFAFNQNRVQKLEPARANKIQENFAERTLPKENDPEEQAIRKYIGEYACGAEASLELTATHELIGSKSFGSYDEGGSRDFQWYLKIFAIANGILLLGAIAGKKGGAFRNVSTGILRGEAALAKGSAKVIGRAAKRGMASASEAMKHRVEHPSEMSAEEAEEEFLRRNPEFRDKNKPF